MNQPLYPTLSFAERAKLLDVPLSTSVPTVIDSDTFNEIDDQFAIAWALLNSERIDLQAIYAAPFTNSMFNTTPEAISDAETGMSLSYNEIHRVLERMALKVKPQVFKGSTRYVKDSNSAEMSPAVIDLIERAENCKTVLQVVVIGAPTNIANALIAKPDLIKKIHIVWLGGHAFDWKNTEEFNLMQDIDASRTLLNSGVALTLVPCMGVANTLATSVPELQHYLLGTSEIGNYLASVAPNCPWIGFGNRKVIWDIAAIGYVISPSWFTSTIQASPVLNDNLTWSFDLDRHPIRVIKYIERDELFVDMFAKLING
ncbi:nucleoside hydrolase [Vibrio sp. Isolate34]|uniref:nucleoside hydrolase n=1 Tax=Vibrio sp. Isolate34 TaxID=2908540 RepID=UPI001EFCC464|nr:nucleoside hydrolase [Vibrio sp. Isolate34]MCG9638386.1 nucleoside hydrolase [Vibrio sp. Isolate34]